MNNVGVIDTFQHLHHLYRFRLRPDPRRDHFFRLDADRHRHHLGLPVLGVCAGAGILQRLVKKALYIGLFTFNTLSGFIFNSFAGLGLKAGGSSISTADFPRPGRLA